MSPSMSKSRNLSLFSITTVACGVFLLLSACSNEESQPVVQAPVEAPVVVEPAPPELKDVIENDARYIIGISYPPSAAKYPGLAEALLRYSETARAELLKAITGVDADKQSSPYDLTLNFTLLAETADVVAVAADGSSFTGGAHGAPLVARFVWLPKHGKLLTSADLLADPRGWKPISDFSREQLFATLSQRVDADEVPAADRAQIMRAVGKMIDEGTDPSPVSFSEFEPVLGPEGDKLMGLRFVFPPYQVGPYVDGVRTVEVPSALLVPYLAPVYRDMFVEAKPQAESPLVQALPTTR